MSLSELREVLLQKSLTEKKRLIIGVSGASGVPIAIACLEECRAYDEVETHLIITRGAEITLAHESDRTFEEVLALADIVYDKDNIGACPASGSYQTCGMLVVPCSMKTLAGIQSGYSDNLLLRAADVTIKEQRPLVLAVRESPFSPVHLRNMSELSMIPNVRIMPPIIPYYNHPKSVEDITRGIAARLLEPFGIQSDNLKRWNGL